MGSPETEYRDNPDADNRHVCARKRAYPDERIARRVAHNIRENRGGDVVHYACRRCGQYHVGATPRE